MRISQLQVHTHMKPRTLSSFGLLQANQRSCYLMVLLGGSAVSIKYTDDQGVDRTLEDGLVSALPMSKLIGPLGISVKIVVAGGTPNFQCFGRWQVEVLMKLTFVRTFVRGQDNWGSGEFQAPRGTYPSGWKSVVSVTEANTQAIESLTDKADESTFV